MIKTNEHKARGTKMKKTIMTKKDAHAKLMAVLNELKSDWSYDEIDLSCLNEMLRIHGLPETTQAKGILIIQAVNDQFKSYIKFI